MSDHIPIVALTRNLAEHKGYKRMAALIAAFWCGAADPWAYPFVKWLRDGTNYPALKVANMLRVLPQRFVCRLAGSVATVHRGDWEVIHRLFWIVGHRACAACKFEVLRSASWVDFGTDTRIWKWTEENWCNEQRTKVHSRACDLVWDLEIAHIGIRRPQ